MSEPSTAAPEDSNGWLVQMKCPFRNGPQFCWGYSFEIKAAVGMLNIGGCILTQFGGSVLDLSCCQAS